jgi:hypothetical protein
MSQLSVPHATFRLKDLLAHAFHLVDVKGRVLLAIFLQGAIDGFKRGVEVTQPSILAEKSEVDQGDVLLRLCP